MPKQRYIGTYIFPPKKTEFVERARCSLCALDGYLDVEADVALPASTDLMPEEERTSCSLGRPTRIPRFFHDDSRSSRIEPVPPRTQRCSTLLAVHSSVSIAAKVEEAKRVRASSVCESRLCVH